MKSGSFDTDGIEKVGLRLRELRKSKSLTLMQLAEKTGFSAGYLSNIERSLCSPTLENLSALCTALDISVFDLLANPESNQFIIRRNNLTRMQDPLGYIYGVVPFPASQKCEFNCLNMTVPPQVGAQDSTWIHPFYEIGTILKGDVNITLDGYVYHLETGDFVLIPPGHSHSLFNLSDTECLTFWIQIGRAPSNPFFIK